MHDGLGYEDIITLQPEIQARFEAALDIVVDLRARYRTLTVQSRAARAVHNEALAERFDTQRADIYAREETELEKLWAIVDEDPGCDGNVYAYRFDPAKRCLLFLGTHEEELFRLLARETSISVSPTV